MRRSLKFRSMLLGIPLLLILGTTTFLLTTRETAIVDPEAQPVLSRFIEFHRNLDLMSARASRIGPGEKSDCLLVLGNPEGNEQFARHLIQGFDDWKPYVSLTLYLEVVTASSEDGIASCGAGPGGRIQLTFPGVGIDGTSGTSRFGPFEMNKRGRVLMDPLARDPFSGRPDSPSPAFPLPMLMDEAGDILDDAREVRYRGEEAIGGIPCIKLEFHHPRSTTPQYVWIASEGDPRLVQIRAVGDSTEAWRFSDWNFDNKASLRLFGQDHRAIRQELLDRTE